MGLNDDRHPTSAGAGKHPGRLYLLLGALLTAAGLIVYALQLRWNVLWAPWYVPILATVGVVFAVLALARARSAWRWAAAVLLALFAAAEWVFLLVLMNTPAYTGPARPGQAFPAFTATLADGSTFTQDNLKGDQNTVLVFFRGHW